MCLTGTGQKPDIEEWRFSKNWLDDGSEDVELNWFGSTSSDPYTASEAEVAESSLGAERRPRSTQGRCSYQSEEANVARRESFNLL